MVMPAVPGAYLICIHAHLAFAAFETCFNAGARFDDARQFPKRWLLQHHPASLRRREGILVAMSGVLLGGIARGTGLPCPLVRQRPTGDHQPLFRADPLALDASPSRSLLALSPRLAPSNASTHRREGLAATPSRIATEPWGDDHALDT